MSIMAPHSGILETVTVHKSGNEAVGVEWDAVVTHTTMGGLPVSTNIVDMTARSVVVGSPAERAGVQVGWRLHSINGVRIRDQEGMRMVGEMEVVRLTLFPPGAPGDATWLEAHLEAFYTRNSPNQLHTAGTTARQWQGKWRELHQKLSSEFPGSDVGFLAAIEAHELARGAQREIQPAEPSKLPGYELGMLGYEEVKGPHGSVWRRESFPGDRWQIVIFDDARKELRCEDRCGCFAPFFCPCFTRRTTIPYKNLPDVHYSDTVRGCCCPLAQTNLFGMPVGFALLSVNGKEIVVHNSGSSVERYIDLRRSM